MKKRTIGIRGKLLFVIIPIMLVMATSFTLIAGKSLTEASTRSLEGQSKQYAETLGGWAGQILAELEVYRDAINKIDFASDADLLKYMESSVDRTDAYPIGLYMGDDSGKYYDASGWVPDSDWVLVERDWYKEGIEHKDFAFGEPYYDSQSGDTCVSATVLMDYPSAKRVLAVDVYLNYLSDIVGQVMQSNVSKAFIVTKSNMHILAHNDPAMLDQAVNEISTDALYSSVSNAINAGKLGVSEINGTGASYYVCIDDIANTDWVLVTCLDKNVALANLYRTIIIYLAITVVLGALMFLLCIAITGRITGPVKKMTDVISSLSFGDFTKSIETKGNDEIGIMSQNLKSFQNDMRGTISDITKMSDGLATQAVTNEEVSIALTNASENQLAAATELKDQAEQLQRDIYQVQNQMSELMDIIKETITEGDTAGNNMAETVKASEAGREKIAAVCDGMNAIETAIIDLAGQIEETDATTAKINEMVNMISEIADQTNLLSLNASIEAARAGEAGKGFAVVAQEIGSLANDSNQAANDITVLTNEIQSNMSKATTQMRESVESVKANARIAEQSQESFTVIFDMIESTNATITNMVERLGNVGRMADSLERIAERQVDSSNTINASAEDLLNYTNSMQDSSRTVSESAANLKATSEGLSRNMDKFTV